MSDNHVSSCICVQSLIPAIHNVDIATQIWKGYTWSTEYALNIWFPSNGSKLTVWNKFVISLYCRAHLKHSNYLIRNLSSFYKEETLGAVLLLIFWSIIRNEADANNSTGLHLVWYTCIWWQINWKGKKELQAICESCSNKSTKYSYRVLVLLSHIHFNRFGKMYVRIHGCCWSIRGSIYADSWYFVYPTQNVCYFRRIVDHLWKMYVSDVILSKHEIQPLSIFQLFIEYNMQTRLRTHFDS